MAEETKNLKVLSASRIKTLETCSWVYWNNYHDKIPQTQNEGALRGTICHTVFELLLKERHKRHYDIIIKNNSINGSKGISKLVKKLSLKVGLAESHYELLDEMKNETSMLNIKGINMFGESNTLDLSDIDLQEIKKYKYHIPENKNLCFFREKIEEMNY